MSKIMYLWVLAAVIIASCTNGCSSATKDDKDSTKVESKVLSAEGIYNNTINKVAMIISYKEGIPYSQGSGFFIDKNTLVTNFHCVAGADKVEFKIAGNEKVYKGAKVVKASDDYDLAIIKTKQDFPFVKIDSLGKEKVGSKIYVIGNPRGLEGTISDGILSGKRDNDGTEYLQITAPINPGNSGGPVLNSKGEVIGVATFTFRNSQNLNFAMPIKYINECKDIVDIHPNKIAKIGHNNDAVAMTSYVKDEASYDAYFSLKNNTDETISNIYYVIIYRATNGEILHYYEDFERDEISPNLAKRFGARGFGDWYDYSCNGEIRCYQSKHPKFTVEFRLISYEIVE